MKWHIARAVGAAPPAQVLREIVKAIIWCTREETSVRNVGLMRDESVGGCTEKIVKYCVKRSCTPSHLMSMYSSHPIACFQAWRLSMNVTLRALADEAREHTCR